MSAGEAFDVAARSLSARDRSRAQVDAYLAERGFDEVARADALEALMRTGIVDDARFAENRASRLAERGAGDARIRFDLRTSGVCAEDVDRAVCAIEGEHDRARRIVDRRGATSKTARYLAGKGFSEDTIGAVVAQASAAGIG